jgi:2-polyprenyl-6-methoxyphenol hydroxylase-like FAD-dependent oxidoreductase
MGDVHGHTGCIVVGGGPGGVMLALLLARKGVEVTLLEMHRDFERDFRGDTVHASTLEVLDQIALAEPLHALPHAKMQRMQFNTSGRVIDLVDLSRLRTKFPYVMIMPQSQFLGFLCERAESHPSFHRIMGAQVVDLLRDDDTVVGVRYRRERDEHELRARLTVAADGRFSRLRTLVGFEGMPLAPPMDVAWFRVTRREDDGGGEQGGAFHVRFGRLLVMVTRPTEWQIGYVFPKGDFHALRERGIDAFRASVAEVVPWLADRMDEIEGFHDVHLLKVGTDRLPLWHCPGLLFIGDAAHIMSPVGGIGINYAIGDAVEGANVLTAPLLDGSIDDTHLAEVQRRRETPTRRAQRMQGFIQENIIAGALREREFDLPLLARIVLRVPLLRDIPAGIIARGFGRMRLEAP